MFFPIAEWLPDQPDFNNPGSSVILNVYPRTEQSYGSVGQLSPILNALGARCQGAAGFRDSSGNTSNFAGTATKLYQSTSAGATWTDVSGATYTIGSDEQWRFSQFGDGIIAHNISDIPQLFTLGVSTTFGTLAAAAPKFRFSCVARNFLLTLNTVDGTNGSKPQRLWWPGIGDPSNWPTLGTTAAAAVQSDAQDIVGDFGWGTGLAANVGPVDVAIFFERAAFRGMYIGAPDIWGIYPANGIKGCIAPGSIQVTEFGVIRLAQDGFYMFSGTGDIPIGAQKIDKTFYADINQSYLNRCSSAIDPINKLYWFAYPSLASNGNPDTLLCCNYSLKSIVGSPGRWAKVSPGQLELLFNSVAFGYNTDTVDILGYNVDTLPFSPDSRALTGAPLQILTAFGSDHKMNYFNGNSLAATVETSEKQLVPGSRGAFTRCRPIMDGGTPTVQPFIRNRIVDSEVGATASVMDANGYCYFKNAEGFYHRQRLTTLAGDNYNHIQGIDVPDDSIFDAGQR